MAVTPIVHLGNLLISRCLFRLVARLCFWQIWIELKLPYRIIQLSFSNLMKSKQNHKNIFFNAMTLNDCPNGSLWRYFLMLNHKFFRKSKSTTFCCLLLLGLQNSAFYAQSCALECLEYPSEIIIYDCDGDGEASLHWALPKALSTGDCGPVKVTQIAGPSFQSEQPIGTYSIGYIAQAVHKSDLSIVSSKLTFRVKIVADQERPVIGNCDQLSRQINGNDLNVSSLGLTIPDLTEWLEPSDNCQIKQMVQNPEAGVQLPWSGKVPISISIDVSDNSGNEANCTIAIAPPLNDSNKTNK